MKRIVAIHQPEHLPWTGFFHKMAQADIYVLLDVVQFTKNNWQNRNRLVDRNGKPFWVTVPVQLKGHTQTTIRDIRIHNAENWRRKYWGRIEQAYQKHPYFRLYRDRLYEILIHDYDYLVALNEALIQYFRHVLDISTPILKASELNVSGRQSELLLSICKKLDASVYLSGPSGKHYLNTPIFTDAGIEVAYHHFDPPIYAAPHYIPCLSTIDILFNHGIKSKTLIGIS